MGDYGNIGAGLVSGIVVIAVAVMLVIGAASWIGAYFVFHSDTIESKTILAPEIKLTTDGKTIDTVYVYHRPKN